GRPHGEGAIVSSFPGARSRRGSIGAVAGGAISNAFPLSGGAVPGATCVGGAPSAPLSGDDGIAGGGTVNRGVGGRARARPGARRARVTALGVRAVRARFLGGRVAVVGPRSRARRGRPVGGRSGGRRSLGGRSGGGCPVGGRRRSPGGGGVVARRFWRRLDV